MLVMDIISLGGPLPQLTWAWEVETGILSGSFMPEANGIGIGGPVQVSGEDGALMLLNFIDGLFSGIDLVICPALENLPILQAPSSAETGRVIVDQRRYKQTDIPVEQDAGIRIHTDPEESTWHLTFAGIHATSVVRVADRMLVELDQTRQFAGLWLEEVPPMPNSVWPPFD